MSNEEDAFLNGGGVAGFKFATVGDTIKGTVTAKELQQQTEYGTGKPLFFDDDSPRMQLAITLATDERDSEIDGDDGTRRVYIKGASKKAGGGSLQAVRDALSKAGASVLEIGSTLVLKYAGDGEPTTAGFKPPKLWEAAYKAPEKAAATAGVGVDELL